MIIILLAQTKWYIYTVDVRTHNAMNANETFKRIYKLRKFINVCRFGFVLFAFCYVSKYFDSTKNVCTLPFVGQTKQ